MVTYSYGTTGESMTFIRKLSRISSLESKDTFALSAAIIGDYLFALTRGVEIKVLESNKLPGTVVDDVEGEAPDGGATGRVPFR